MELSELKEILDDRYAMSGTEVERSGYSFVSIRRRDISATVFALATDREKFALDVYINDYGYDNPVYTTKSNGKYFGLTIPSLELTLDVFFPRRKEYRSGMKTGHWIELREDHCDDNEVDYYTCSECGYSFGEDSNYCPHCGARMEKNDS